MSDQNDRRGTLADVRVVDLSRVLAGPFCTKILGDHGADLIKVEPPMGDETRDWGPPFETDGNGEKISSSYFHGLTRNKRCIALDLSTEVGRSVVFRLLEAVDVVVKNFKVGTLEKWGMGYEDVRSRHFLRLVHCRITGFGTDGPLGGAPGYNAVVQAISGLGSVNGNRASDPLRMRGPIVDLSTGFNTAIGIGMALVERDRSGKGQQIEVTLYDSGMSILFSQATNWLMSGEPPMLTGNQHPNVVPYDLFSTQTKPIFIGVGNNRQFRSALEVLGRPRLADDERFRTNADRNINCESLTKELTAAMKNWKCEELTRRLLEAEVPAGPANGIREVLQHAHTQHRGFVIKLDGYRGVGAPVKFSRTPPAMRTRPPLFAADNRAVLEEEGYSESEIEAMITNNAVVSERTT